MPALQPLSSSEKGLTISNVSVVFDASVFKVWRDGTELGLSAKEPYWAMDLHIAGVSYKHLGLFWRNRFRMNIHKLPSEEVLK